MTQAERIDVDGRPVADHDVRTSAACSPAAAPFRSRTRPRRGRTWSTRSRRPRSRPARHPAAVRRRLGARPREPARRHRLPAQHRPRRHPRPAAARADRPHHRQGDAGLRPATGRSRRASAWPATTAGAGPTRASASHPRLVKQLETVIDGLQGRPGQLDRPDRVLATAKHYAGDGLTTFGTPEGDYTVDQGIDQVSRAEFEELALSPYPKAIDRAPRRLGDAVVLQRRLDRRRPRQPGQDARQQGADHRRPQGRDRLRRLRDLRLAGDPPDPG